MSERTSLLRCEAVRKTFGGVSAVAGVDLAFPPAGVVAIVGPNGAGKTTLFDILSGFTRPDGGRCFLGDSEITGLPPERIARLGLARTFQSLRLISRESALDNVLLGRPAPYGENPFVALFGPGVAREEAGNRSAALHLLDEVGLAAAAATPAGELSWGQQKLLSIACCLATGARCLLLDEPLAGVHPELALRIEAMLRRLAAEDRLVVFIEHDLAAVERSADRVVVLDGGAVLADGSPTDVLARPEIAEAYLG